MPITRRTLTSGLGSSLLGASVFGGSVLAPVTAWAATPEPAFAYSRERNGVSVLMLDATGQVLAEDYANGGGQGEAWELASGTKSFAGLAFAAAVGEGLLRLDQTCASVLSEWRNDARSAITIRALLSLTSGLGGGGIGRPPPYAEAIAARPTTEPGARFSYGPVPFQVFGEILRRVTQRDPLDYYQQRLFDPIGVKPGRWRRGSDGLPHLPSGGALTARDWGRFGVMTLNGWIKDNRPLVDRASLAACFEGTSANPGYGLTWWLLRPGLVPASPRAGLRGDRIGQSALEEDVVMAAGAGNQRLYILRKRKLVIVRQANRIGQAMMGRGPDWSDDAFLRLLLT